MKLSLLIIVLFSFALPGFAGEEVSTCAIKLQEELVWDQRTGGDILERIEGFTDDDLINRFQVLHILQVQRGDGSQNSLENRSTFNLGWLRKKKYSGDLKELVEHFDPESANRAKITPAEWVDKWEKAFVKYGGKLADDWVRPSSGSRRSGRDRFLEALFELTGHAQQKFVGQGTQPAQWTNDPDSAEPEFRADPLRDPRIANLPQFQPGYDSTYRRLEGSRTPAITHPLRGRVILTEGDLETAMILSDLPLKNWAPSRAEWNKLRRREDQLKAVAHAIKSYGDEMSPLGVLFLTRGESDETQLGMEWAAGEDFFASIPSRPNEFFVAVQRRVGEDFALKHAGTDNYAQEILIQGAITFERLLKREFSFQMDTPGATDYLNPDTALWTASDFTLLDYRKALKARRRALKIPKLP